MTPRRCKIRPLHSVSSRLNVSINSMVPACQLLSYVNKCQLHKFQSQARTQARCSARIKTWKSRRFNLPVRAAVATVEVGTPRVLEGDVVLLTVQNMKCGGCSAAVKRMLLKDPSIENAAVNLLTGTAVIELKEGSAREETISRALYSLTTKGFPTSIRQPSDDDVNLLVQSGPNSEAKDK